MLIVGLGTERSNPDYYALSVMNEIFSGGFGSRVVQNVRTKLGLAYSRRAEATAPRTITRGSSTSSPEPRASHGCRDQGDARRGRAPRKALRPRQASCAKAKDQLLNSFIFHYDSPDKTLNEQVTLAFYGYPADFLEKYKTGIENVTAADVSRVANKYVDPSKLGIVVVGNQSEIKPALDALGKVTAVDITIPPPAGKPAE